MDPPLISESSFSAANPSAYTLAEIWPFASDQPGSGLRARNGLGESGSAEESTVTELSTGEGARKRREVSSEDDSCKNLNGSNGKRTKTGVKASVEGSSVDGDKPAEQADKASDPPKLDYIHVRARRGQATDSHSLAERARREKISERMKTLQDLVPGCNKVLGKALVLDEIINYIQSLQHQVEFLSMKLETVNARSNLNPAMDGFPSKDLGVQAFDGLLYGSQSQAPRDYAHPEWLHMQVGATFERPS